MGPFNKYYFGSNSWSLLYLGHFQFSGPEYYYEIKKKKMCQCHKSCSENIPGPFPKIIQDRVYWWFATYPEIVRIKENIDRYGHQKENDQGNK